MHQVILFLILLDQVSHYLFLHSTIVTDPVIPPSEQAGPSKTLRPPKRRTKSGKAKLPTRKPSEEIRAPSLPKTELYLESIIAQGSEPTPADLEQFRPPQPTQQDLRSPAYKTIYEETSQALDRSFTVQQLRALAQQILSKQLSSRITKPVVMELILNKVWGLPSPAPATPQ